MTDPRWQTVREQLLCEVDQGWDGGDALAALDSLEGKMEWLRSRDKILQEALRIAVEDDLGESVERYIEAAALSLGGEE